MFWMILSQWVHVFLHLSRLIDCTTPRVGPKVSHGLWVMVYQSRLMVLMGTHSGAGYGIDSGRGAEQEPRGLGSNGNALDFLFHFPMNLKLT